MEKGVKILMILALLSVSTVAFCGGAVVEENRTFVDDVGREITLPVTIDAVSPSGPLAQIVLYSLDQDLFVSVSSEFTDAQATYIDPRLLTLPVTGQFYGSKASTMNPESIMELNRQLNIDVVLDIGEAKQTMKTDLDDIQAKTNVPFAFITQNKLEDIPGSYVKLGELLSRPERGQELSDYVSALLAEFDSGMKKVGDNKKSLIYVTAIDGNSVSMVGSGSYHAEVIDYLANNLAKPAASSSGTGDGYTMEDILQMDPDYIIVGYTDGHAYYNEIMTKPMWQSLSAVKEGNVYEAPYGPYNWMGGPPSVQRLLSMIWLGNLMYPDVFDYTIDDRVKEFYSLFFRYDLTDAELDNLMVYAKPGTAPTSAPTPAQSPAPLFGVLAGLAAAAAIIGAGRRR
ncbi:ABC transporter substrate-binding protein [Methanoculleus bourgensis]|uniref:Periplasmic binding protein n=1 Tax=Methanoculleus bourgensis TaxID=83986 RepID=A0A0X3BIN5_9EURY|nr:ABC transporter substrate-binding protein [Methanoculleus bourgensis]NQS74773.1 ABC transporter substrate-binding protein [Methanoculleus sp.]CVK31928.1 Periplasmic binding protein [Methanoculleus bourgensis]